MAVITPSSLISEIRGSVGDVTYSRNRSGPIVKQKLTQTVTRTEDQIIYRNAVADAVSLWQALTQEEQNTYIALSGLQPVRYSISRIAFRAGFNEFVSRILNRTVIGGSGLPTNINQREIVSPIITINSSTQSAIEVAWSSIFSTADVTLAIYATAPLSPGINSPSKSAFKLIKVSSITGSSGTIDITSEYLALFTPSAVNTGDKIFFEARAIREDNFLSSPRSRANSIYDHGTYIPEYQAVIDYAVSQGYILPSAAQRNLQNTMLSDLIDAGIWAQLDIFYVWKNNGSSEFSTINWCNPGSNNASPSGSAAWTSNVGWNTDGSSGGLDTNWSPSSGNFYTQNDCSIFAYLNNNIFTTLQWDFGVYQGAPAPYEYVAAICAGATANSVRSVINAANNVDWQTPTNSNLTSIGFYQIQRKSSSNNYVYKNGSQIGSNTSITSSARSTYNLYACCRNLENVIDSPSTRGQAVLGAGASLDGLEGTLNTIIATYVSTS